MNASSFNLDLVKIAELYNHGSVIESQLVGWLGKAFQQYGAELRGISGAVAQSGEGMWTVEAAKELGVPASIIKGALDYRLESQKNPSYVGQIVSALRHEFGGHEVREAVKRKE
jgi:6-phosphogluconate dehydrogenase